MCAWDRVQVDFANLDIGAQVVIVCYCYEEQDIKGYMYAIDLLYALSSPFASRLIVTYSWGFAPLVADASVFIASLFL